MSQYLYHNNKKKKTTFKETKKIKLDKNISLLDSNVRVMLNYLIIIILFESEINSFSRNISDYCYLFESESKGDYSSNGVYSTKCQ